nr:MAG TPA: hypothetical protein [Caudoviricetes sp.]
MNNAHGNSPICHCCIVRSLKSKKCLSMPAAALRPLSFF